MVWKSTNIGNTKHAALSKCVSLLQTNFTLLKWIVYCVVVKNENKVNFPKKRFVLFLKHFCLILTYTKHDNILSLLSEVI